MIVIGGGEGKLDTGGNGLSGVCERIWRSEVIVRFPFISEGFRSISSAGSYDQLVNFKKR